MEALGTLLGFIVTLAILSYALGIDLLDRLLFRTAVYIFAGLAAGYITIVTVEGVLAPMLFGKPEETLLLVIAFVLGALLLFKGTSRLSWLGNITLAILIAVGASVALVGAITGTLLPLLLSTGQTAQHDLGGGLLMFVGVVCTLVYFQYLAKRTPGGAVTRGRVSRVLGTIGEGFIVVTFGALYATAIITSVTVLSSVIGSLLTGS